MINDYTERLHPMMKYGNFIEVYYNIDIRMMMRDTCKVNILRICIVPVDVVVKVQIIEELSFFIKLNYCKIYVLNSLVFYYMYPTATALHIVMHHIILYL